MVVTINLNEVDERRLNDLIEATGEDNKSYIFRRAMREMHQNFFTCDNANRHNQEPVNTAHSAPTTREGAR